MAKHKQKNSRNSSTLSPFTFPAVSIIIPLYNAEKYIGECLDSLLAQTFQNFEVIVVDDCSTDNSVAVVESYTDKFGERLKLTKTNVNSGGPSEPSNLGICFSRGEYLLILDNDDAITPTALEELYPIAKNFNADVVACEKYYDVPEKFWYNAEFRRQLKPFSYQSGEFVKEPTLITSDISERLKLCYGKQTLWNVWSKLLRRDFLASNKIYFKQNVIQDMLFTCCLLFSAERYVKVPNVINYYRVLGESLSHKQESPEKYFVRHVRTLKNGFSFLDKFLSEREPFSHNLKFKYLALEIFANEVLWYLQRIYEHNPIYMMDSILRKELGEGNNVALMTFIFSLANIQRLKLIQAQQQRNQIVTQANQQLNQIVTQANQQFDQFNQFAAQAQRRIAELEAEVRRLKSKE